MLLKLQSIVNFPINNDPVTLSNKLGYRTRSGRAAPPKEKACSQKNGNIANVRTSRQGAKNLQFLSGCNF